MLSEGNTYNKVKKNPTVKFQTRVNKLISNLENKGVIDIVQAKQLKTYNSIPPKLATWSQENP